LFFDAGAISPVYEWPIKFCTFITLALYILSDISGNASQVDRLWTFLPTIYAGYFALLPLWPQSSPVFLLPYVPADVDPKVTGDFSARAVLMFGLTLIWTSRLTYNTYRKGLFTWKAEDYRWEVLRNTVPTWLFKVTNLIFIAIIQNILLFTLAIPVLTAVHQPHTSLSTSDYLLLFIGVAVHIIEFIADNQHQSFHKYKRSGLVDPNEWAGARIQWTPADAKRGFITRGLWAWSRHPNFACEQLCWIIINLFPILHSLPSRFTEDRSYVTAIWALAPSLAHCFLFFNSTIFTESITSSKYAGYAAYQQRVSMFVPWMTPVWGLLLKLRGKKEEVDAIVYGNGLKEE